MHPYFQNVVSVSRNVYALHILFLHLMLGASVLLHSVWKSLLAFHKFLHFF